MAKKIKISMIIDDELLQRYKKKLDPETNGYFEAELYDGFLNHIVSFLEIYPGDDCLNFCENSLSDFFPGVDYPCCFVESL